MGFTAAVCPPGTLCPPRAGVFWGVNLHLEFLQGLALFAFPSPPSVTPLHHHSPPPLPYCLEQPPPALVARFIILCKHPHSAGCAETCLEPGESLPAYQSQAVMGQRECQMPKPSFLLPNEVSLLSCRHPPSFPELHMAVLACNLTLPVLSERRQRDQAGRQGHLQPAV